MLTCNPKDLQSQGIASFLLRQTRTKTVAILLLTTQRLTVITCLTNSYIIILKIILMFNYV